MRIRQAARGRKYGRAEDCFLYVLFNEILQLRVLRLNTLIAHIRRSLSFVFCCMLLCPFIVSCLPFKNKILPIFRQMCYNP